MMKHHSKRIKGIGVSITFNGLIGHGIDVIGDNVDVCAGVYYGNQHVWLYIRTGNLPRKKLIDISTKHTVIDALEKIERWCATQRNKMYHLR